MSHEFMSAFENVWIELRAKWCDALDLGDALAFSHDRVKIDFFHRVVRVRTNPEQVDGLIDAALELFQRKQFDCLFTLSPLDRPADLGALLTRRGFAQGKRASVMMHDSLPQSAPSRSAVHVDVSDDHEYDVWAQVMCRSFEHPREVAEVGRSVLTGARVRRYLARVDGVPAGTTLLYTQPELAYVDLVGTLPEYRRKGVATALVQRAVSDSKRSSSPWTSLETLTGSAAERLYESLGFRTVYHRERYIRQLSRMLPEIS